MTTENQSTNPNELARRPADMQPLAVSPTPGRAEIANMTTIANAMAKSGCLSKSIRNPEQAFVIMLAGRELGVGPMQALRDISIIEGKTCLSAQAILARVHKLRLGVARVITSTAEECEMYFERADDPENRGTVVWALADAVRAGLLTADKNGNITGGKDNWRKYPRAMLFNRCASEGAKRYFPDASGGLYTVEEMGGEDEPGDIIDVDFVDVTPERFRSASAPAEPSPTPVDAKPVETPSVSSPATTAEPSKPAAASPAPPDEPTAQTAAPITPLQVGVISAIAKAAKPTAAEWKARLSNMFDTDSIQNLDESQADELIVELVNTYTLPDGSASFIGELNDNFATYVSRLTGTATAKTAKDPKPKRDETASAGSASQSNAAA